MVYIISVNSAAFYFTQTSQPTTTNSLSRSERFDMSPSIPITFLPISDYVLTAVYKNGCSVTVPLSSVINEVMF